MKILGIETSCDETAVAVLEAERGNFKILSDVVSTQVKIHEKYGGVVPNLAKREHQKNLTPVLREALSSAKLLSPAKRRKEDSVSGLSSAKKILEREQELYRLLSVFLVKQQTPKIDLIAVVNGPGLEPALWVGVNFAKVLSFWWKKPIVPVNHLEAHLLVNFLEHSQDSMRYPALYLLVSGGHTMLILMEGIGKYKIIGETRDDSAGECFDKAARLLGLGYPGGPAIHEAAKKALPRYSEQIKLPRPMLHSKDYDFSFSGLKTAVLYHYKKQLSSVQKSKNYISAMAAEIQQAIIDVLVAKTLRAARAYKVKTVMIGGGVAANAELRKRLGERLATELPGIDYIEPRPQFCTDNGLMAASAGFFTWKKTQATEWQDIEADANMRI